MTMKKMFAWFAGITAALVLVVLVGCAGPAPKDHTITFDAWMFESSEDADVRSSFEEQGCTGITKNDDGSWTITMPGEKYEEYVTTMRTGVQESLDKLVDSEDWPNIADVENDQDFTEVTITLKTDKETLMDLFAPVAVGLSACIYQKACDLPVSCHIVTLGANGTQLNEVTYPLATSE